MCLSHPLSLHLPHHLSLYLPLSLGDDTEVTIEVIELHDILHELSGAYVHGYAFDTGNLSANSECVSRMSRVFLTARMSRRGILQMEVMVSKARRAS